MKEELKVNLNDIKLHSFENVVEIRRNVDVGKHLPQDIIGKGSEFTRIREIENMELSRLWAVANRLMRNTYIQSFDSKGLEAYKKLIDDDSIKGDLEAQRKIVYGLWNLVGKWTHRTLIEWMNATVGEGNYDMNILYNEYGIEFSFFIFKNFSSNTKWLAKQLRKIIPANLWIRFRIVNLQKIYYGMYEQKAKKNTIMPAKPLDKEHDLNVIYGGAIGVRRIKRVAQMPEIWIENKDGMMLDVFTEDGGVLKYDRD